MKKSNINTVILLFGILLLSFIWIGLFYKMRSEQQLEVDSAIQKTTNFAYAVEENALRTINSTNQTVLFLKYLYEKRKHPINIPQYINEGSLASQPFIWLAVIDENGDLAASSRVPFVPFNLKDREYFIVHQDFDNDQLFINKPVLGQASGQWSIPMTHRINKPDGSFGGIAVGSVDPLYFSEFYNKVNLGKNSTIALLGRDGRMRAQQTNQDVTIGQDVSQDIVMEKLAISSEGYYIAQNAVDGIKRIYSYRAMKNYPLVVVVGVDEAEVLQNLNQRFAVYYLAAGIVTAVVVWFTIMLLAAAARQKDTEAALKQTRDNLETEVKQRTQELFLANEELIALNAEHIQMNENLQQKNTELTTALKIIRQTQNQLIQQEKLAGIGQLAAGVAHEINNPLGFVTGNVEMLEEYFSVLSDALAKYREIPLTIATSDKRCLNEAIAEINQYEAKKDLDFILDDLPELFHDTIDGLNRMNKIVKGMRSVYRSKQPRVLGKYNLIDGLESTLLVANNEIKPYACVEKQLQPIPVIEAVGDEINQVLLNLIVNAAQSIKAKTSRKTGVITICTWYDDHFIYCSCKDNGSGIEPENLKHVFNPFFTTKPVGQGMGMGLSISYDIIVSRHNGDISVESIPGKWAKFTIKLPICPPLAPETAD